MTLKQRIESDSPTCRFAVQFLTVRGLSTALPGPTPKANTPPRWRLEFQHTSCTRYLVLRASRRLPRLMECHLSLVRSFNQNRQVTAAPAEEGERASGCDLSEKIQNRRFVQFVMVSLIAITL